jgi:KamA family protein
MNKIHYINKLSEVPQLSARELHQLERVSSFFPFQSNSYYLGLIDWRDKADPIRRLVIPITDELDDTDWGTRDPSCEADYTVVPGLQHKYDDTALMLVSGMCGSLCRYCFRKRLFMEEREREIVGDCEKAIDYIRDHIEINNVILTGGDPLCLKTEKLRHFVSELRNIQHIGVIRVGTKMVAYNPFRIIEDPELPAMIEEFSTTNRRIYFMLHFSHPNEITPQAVTAVDILIKSGAILCNQTPIVRGVNDDPRVMADLFNRLSFIGIAPYYIFINRPAVGNKPYAVPITRAYGIFQEARRNIAGVAKRAALSMSHSSGKIEVVGLDEDNIYMRYHRAANNTDVGRMVIARRDDTAYWFDDLKVNTPAGVGWLPWFRR